VIIETATANTDGPGDPHAITRSGWYAHVGWMFRRRDASAEVRRRCDSRSPARESALTALITFGDGDHNIHHRFPDDDRNGARWWQYDPSKWLIHPLGRVRLASALPTASAANVAAAIEWARLATIPALRP
jgi:fatty-acid desaturase